MSRPVQPCGTRAAYSRGCHCDACRAAYRRYQHDWRIGSLPAATVDRLPPVTLPGPWVNQAACRGLDPELFFPEQRGAGIGKTIRAVCHGCAVRDDCLAWAVRNELREGWYGGMSPRGRARIRSRYQ